jgi:hypothetical protein
LALAEKELQQTRNDNQVLTQYIQARRKKEETKKSEGRDTKEGRGGGLEEGYGGGLMIQ